MGYISDVTMYIRESDDFKKKFNNLENFINLSNMAEESEDECFTIRKNSKGERVLKIYFDYVKWYEDYPIVQFYEKAVEKLDENDYLFVRCGEEVGDFEITGFYGNAYPRLTIDYEVNFIDDAEEVI